MRPSKSRSLKLSPVTRCPKNTQPMTEPLANSGTIASAPNISSARRMIVRCRWSWVRAMFAREIKCAFNSNQRTSASRSPNCNSSVSGRTCSPAQSRYGSPLRVREKSPTRLTPAASPNASTTAASSVSILSSRRSTRGNRNSESTRPASFVERRVSSLRGGSEPIIEVSRKSRFSCDTFK